MQGTTIDKEDLIEPELTENAREVLARRYLKTDMDGNPIERPKDMFFRVASTVAEPEREYGGQERVDLMTKKFYNMMARGIWVPNSPTLFNAGREIGQLSACFVLPVEDSMTTEDNTGIMDTLRNAALIHKSGGGTGFAFSRLRPEGSRVGSTAGVATGPVSFMKMYDAMTETVKQGGHRRGANMGILRVDHPDILKFIRCKQDTSEVTNFNISVAVTDDFVERALADEEYPLVDHEGRVVEHLNARDVLEEIAENAWATGEPGLFFIDEANKHNPVPQIGDYEATNPCGEQPLMPFDVCNLGSLNVGHDEFVNPMNGTIRWERLKEYVFLGVRFLDNVIEVNNYPLPEIRERSNEIRRIGDGVMGWADMLTKMGWSYDSDNALDLAGDLAKFLHLTRMKASEKLADERGTFPAWEESVWGPDATCARDEDGNRIRPERTLRNCNVDTVAPTGTISIIAGCSSGIEPLYAVAFMRNQAGTKMPDVNEQFVQQAKREGWYSEDLMRRIASEGTIDLKDVPDSAKYLFRTAHDIAPEDHVRMQAVWQNYTHSAISKTINLPQRADPEGVLNVYKQAYELGCKGITVYRDGSRSGQALSVGSSQEENGGKRAEQLIDMGVCPECEADLREAEGCSKCPSCGFAVCG